MRLVRLEKRGVAVREIPLMGPNCNLVKTEEEAAAAEVEARRVSDDTLMVAIVTCASLYVFIAVERI